MENEHVTIEEEYVVVCYRCK